MRRLHCLRDQLLPLFAALARSLKGLSTSFYLIDSFPVAVCDNIRIARSHLLRGEAYRGKCVSRRRYFYGFRIQVITTLEGVPVQFFNRAATAEGFILKTSSLSSPIP